MAFETYSHLVEIKEEERLLVIYRISGAERQLYTAVIIPEKTWANNSEEIKEFCRMVGENIIIDSPQARKLLGL